MTSKNLTILLTVTANQGAPRVSLEIEESITVCDLLSRISNVTAIPTSSLKVIYRGKLISNKQQNSNDNNNNASVVKEFSLEQGSVLHCIGKPTTTNTASDAASSSSTAMATSSTSSATLNASVPSVATTSNATAPSNTTTPSNTVSPLTNAINQLRARNHPNDYQTALSTMDKLLQNIIQHPMEAKYRTIKKQNPAITKRLLGKEGGHDLMLACGFVETTHNNDNNTAVYQMEASPQAWPSLLATKQEIGRATSAASAMLNNHPPPAMPGMANMAQGMPNNTTLPQLPPAAQQLLSNPQQLTAMLQNPMVQNMLRNDPRFANQPHMQNVLEMMQSNPEMIAQMSNLFAAGGAVPGGAASAAANNHTNNIPPASLFSGMGAGTTGSSSSSSSASNNNNGNDASVTEEEMIAEAIRRSLEDNNNNNNNGSS